MILITIFLLLFSSVTGFFILTALKLFKRSWKHSYTAARLSTGLFGLGMCLLGFYAYEKTWVYGSFITGFCVVIGGQISLWSIGIRSEALGTNTKLGVSSKSFDFSLSFESLQYVLLIPALFIGCSAIYYYIFELRDFKSSKSGFIGQVSAATILPQKPKWVTASIESVDSFGEEVVIDIGILWDPYRWVKGSVDYVAVNEDEKVKIQVESIIKDFDPSEKRPIIAVGLASHENATENPELESARAQFRADSLLRACELRFYNTPNLYSINLGAFKASSGLSMFSASERRVVLIVINKGEDSKDLSSGIKNALIAASKKYNYIFDPNDYSLFNNPRFKVLTHRKKL